ncbi:MAG TPA: methyltransferase domain-containing protein [Candidatus Gastranaerophilales bacterium]|nr:methyltransferase domain-containing protein [Candidatus Gastranaerophilales bacterium]
MKFINNIVKKFKKKLTVGLYNDQPREQWVINKIKELPNGYKLLDAGAGELKYKKYCGHLNYISQDFAQYDGKGDGVGLQIGTWDNSKLDIISDITNIPRENNSFDAIMCTDVFEHLPNPIKAVQEFSRLIKKGGKLIITAPFCSLTHFAPYHFCTGFNKYFFEHHLSENDFDIIEISYNGNFFEYIAQELKRTRSVAEEYCSYKLNKKESKQIKNVLKILQNLTEKDTKSYELLNHGLFIYAEKRN